MEEVKEEKGDLRRFKFLFVFELMAIAVIAILLVLVISGHAPWAYGKTKILSVEATDLIDGVVKSDSHFLVKAENGSVDAVRKAVYLEPAIDYEIEEKVAGSLYEIIPTSSLSDNLLLNIDSVSNEVIDYKWAFQTKKDLSVSKIYPRDGASYVSENSVIEFSFSYPDVEGVESHFSISPKVEGQLTKDGRIWRFKPSMPLSKDTSYQITITAGLKYGEEVMKNDFHSTFSTMTSSSVSYQQSYNYGLTLDNVVTFTEKENPIIYVDNQKAFDSITKLTVEKINSVDDYIKYLNGDSGITGEEIGDFAFKKTSQTRNSYIATTMITADNNFSTGYYIFKFKDNAGQLAYKANVQINNMVAYAMESERDVLVWVAKDGELASDVKVNFKGKDYRTDNSGLLTIKDVSDFSKKIDYIKVGDFDQPLTIAIENFENGLYPNGFIYSDKPLYKPTDTIKVWGFVPLKFFRDAPNRNNFSVTFGTIKKTVSVDEDGFFSTEIVLDNYKDTKGGLSLGYNDKTLAYKNVEVEDYTLENYNYTFITDKNYVNAGENINVKIKVEHVTGFPAVNKDLVVTYKKHDYYATTNGAGEASFTFPTDKVMVTEQSTSNLDYEDVEVKSGGAEYGKYTNYARFYIFKNNLIISGAPNAGSNEIVFNAKSLDLSKKVKTDFSYKNLERSNYSGNATLKLYEQKVSRRITSYNYNNYTKEQIPIYKTDYMETLVGTVPVTFEDGVAKYTYSTDFKESEENVYYNYYAILVTTDTTGRPAASSRVIYHQGNYLGNSSPSDYNAILGSYSVSSPRLGAQYYYYRFGLKDVTSTTNTNWKYGMGSTNKYSVDDSIRFGLHDVNGTNIENKGKVLAVALKENIVSTNVFSENTFDLKFDINHYPGVAVVGAYFVDGRFYRIAPYYHDYNEADSELKIKITTDKESYEPGNTVKAKVTIERADGTRVDNARVNMSVVNEAIFNAMDDDTSILSKVYANKSYMVYSMSTYYDYALYTEDGGLGSAFGGRADFGDTLYFDSKNMANGEVEFDFKLNDSITSFRLTAIAVENGDVINAGAGTHTIASYLPLSISTVMPKKVKNTDDVVLNATSIVAGGKEVEYEFHIDEIDKTVNAKAEVGRSVYANFGKLEVGKYTVHIKGHDSDDNEDHMVQELTVVETAQEVAIKKTMEINSDTTITPVKNPIIVEIYDKNTKQYLNYLDHLRNNLTVRLDTQIAYYKSLEFSDKYYKENSSLVKPDFSGYLMPDKVLKPLENAQGDLVLTALSNFYAPSYFDLKASNYSLEIDDDSSVAIKKLMLLASFKEPVLLDLKAAAKANQKNVDYLNLALAFAMLGDYDSAKDCYSKYVYDNEQADLVAVLKTMIDKEDAENQINLVLESKPSADYLDFAIISYFIYNEEELDKKHEVVIKTSAGEEKIEVTPLTVEKRILYMDELKDLSFNTSSDELLTTYYYQGKLSELEDGVVTDLGMKLEGNLNRNATATLVLDVSKLTGTKRNGEINLALPAGLKFSATFDGVEGLYLIRNNNEYVKLSLSENYKNTVIRIPLYVTAPGNYEIEPVVYTTGGEYHLSNSLVVDLK